MLQCVIAAAPQTKRGEHSAGLGRAAISCGRCRRGEAVSIVGAPFDGRAATYNSLILFAILCMNLGAGQQTAFTLTWQQAQAEGWQPHEGTPTAADSCRPRFNLVWQIV